VDTGVVALSLEIALTANTAETIVKNPSNINCKCKDEQKLRDCLGNDAPSSLRGSF